MIEKFNTSGGEGRKNMQSMADDLVLRTGVYFLYYIDNQIYHLLYARGTLSILMVLLPLLLLLLLPGQRSPGPSVCKV